MKSEDHEKEMLLQRAPEKTPHLQTALADNGHFRDKRLKSCCYRYAGPLLRGCSTPARIGVHILAGCAGHTLDLQVPSCVAAAHL
eukprot:914403-Pelagomonas_calceolata.AAC.2